MSRLGTKDIFFGILNNNNNEKNKYFNRY